MPGDARLEHAQRSTRFQDTQLTTRLRHTQDRSKLDRVGAAVHAQLPQVDAPLPQRV
jgi:hypothetical protein